ncbi:hypothetical protein CEXT_384491 [Caerostris extrusa]|uniref:Uncharacterized protein n=1 Tax=Caerostris extrusa TaxID=172846 RepID=A0AAV4Q1M3_CAEEX|nr:hypothetical protein CEXT_384491 [Caerostris extrusa]
MESTKKLQEQLGCVIGKDYPFPIVDHDKVRIENLRRMDAVYKAKKEMKDQDKKVPVTKSKKSDASNEVSKGKHSLDTNKDVKISKFFKKN